MSKKRLIGRLNSFQIIPFFCYRLAVKYVFDKCSLQYKNIPFLTVYLNYHQASKREVKKVKKKK